MSATRLYVGASKAIERGKFIIGVSGSLYHSVYYKTYNTLFSCSSQPPKVGGPVPSGTRAIYDSPLTVTVVVVVGDFKAAAPNCPKTRTSAAHQCVVGPDGRRGPGTGGQQVSNLRPSVGYRSIPIVSRSPDARIDVLVRDGTDRDLILPERRAVGTRYRVD